MPRQEAQENGDKSRFLGLLISLSAVYPKGLLAFPEGQVGGDENGQAAHDQAAIKGVLKPRPESAAAESCDGAGAEGKDDGDDDEGQGVTTEDFADDQEEYSDEILHDAELSCAEMCGALM